jgi:telomerase reverse transcriptase
VGGIYPALQKFKQQLAGNGPLYLAKVDVQACFDNLPVNKVLAMIRRDLSSTEYSISRYARVKRPVKIARTGQIISKARIKFDAAASSTDGAEPVLLEQPNSVLIRPIGFRQQKSRQAIIKLLEEHLLGNTVKIGRKFYRQKVGVPQGSVVSTILCTMFYSLLEQADLSFLDRPDTLLLRLVDDFLVISTDASTASRFLKVMHAGIPAFGMSVNPRKSLANFDLNINDSPVAKCLGNDFPYCGLMVNTLNLSVSKDMQRLDPAGKCTTNIQMKKTDMDP